VVEDVEAFRDPALVSTYHVGNILLDGLLKCAEFAVMNTPAIFVCPLRSI